MIRLGVATRILGRSTPRAGRGAASQPAHLSQGLLALRDRLVYLQAQGVGLYRLADDLLPPRAQLTERLAQLGECAALVEEIGQVAQRAGIRLTMHLGLHMAISAPDEALARRASDEIIAQAALLDALGCGPDAVLVVHGGGAFGDQQAALHRFASRYERLPATARCRLVIEPDEDCFALPDLLRLHQISGIPLVLDTLHHQLNNRQQIPLASALGLALATWPRGVRPKVHYSSQRTEAHVLSERGTSRIVPPRPGQHADYANPHEFAMLLAAAQGLGSFDVMIEAKAADLAVIRLRDDLRRYAPALAAGVG